MKQTRIFVILWPKTDPLKKQISGKSVPMLSQSASSGTEFAGVSYVFFAGNSRKD